MRKTLVLIWIAACCFAACKKDSFIAGPEALLSTSADTLRFDTVFTTTGSVTQFFKIYNNNPQKLRISAIQLKGGAASFFKMNVDGLSGYEITNLELDANDSTYVFVTVKIDPNTADLPFVVQDSIRINFNGNEHWVQLEAWGQNARFLRNRVVNASESWDNQKPYVILGGLQVAPEVTLTITPGTRIYLHADAPLIIDGTLRVAGQRWDSTRVIFQGDRLDDPYRDFPAGWPGIYFTETSKNNLLEYAIIKNAYQGLVAEKPSVNSNPKLALKACIIDNCYDAGILGLRSDVSAENCLISNCGKNIALAYGGNYQFTHCTSASYSNPYFQHKEPGVIVTDFIKSGNSLFTGPLNATFTNCIFWGDNGVVENEVVTSKQGNNFSVSFRNCLWKAKTTPANSTLSNIIANESPLFDSLNINARRFNFRLREGSPALNKGLGTPLVSDLDGHPRPVGLPDLGCYEKQ